MQKPGKKCRNKECGADISKVKSPTHGLRFHDLRHHAITELSEGQASDQTIMSIAGHVSPKMLAHYSHVRLDAKRKALDALSGGSSGSGCGTNYDTIAPVAPEPSPQVIETNGRPGRTRTSDLFRVNLSWLGITTTYRTAGTAKTPESRTRQAVVWVGLWVGKTVDSDWRPFAKPTCPFRADSLYM